tara:strand:- start:130 stop:375 length:246 start_codon:yes stop_codon:yes gene_type:complete
MNKDWDDSNWREESLPYYTGKQEELLRNGPKSLSQSWIMSAMYNEWMRRNGYKNPEPPDVSSSMSEYFQKEQEFLIEDNEN